MDDLTSTAGAVALAAGALALVALAVAVRATVLLRRLRADQRAILGDREVDLVGHAAGLAREFEALHAYVGDVALRLDGRLGSVEERLDGAVAFRGLVRYDAYNEAMSGRQSCSIALLDAGRSGVVISSIHHRDQARVYAKHVTDGVGDTPLSPEEEEAVRLALAGEPPPLPEPLR